MREWLTRFLDWFRRGRLDRELREELQFHERQLTRRAAEDGATLEEAQRAARVRLGNVRRVQEEARDRWSLPAVEGLGRDVRHAARSLRRTPAFTLAVVVTLSLGIGANVVMFDVTDRLLFRPLTGLRDPGTVHRVYMRTTEATGENTSSWLSPARYEDLRQGTSSFSEWAAFSERAAAVGLGDAARELRIAGVSASYFDFFDAPAAQGRYFTAAEDTAPGGTPVAVISHAYWQSAFAGSPVIGQPLQIGSLAATIVGVAHPDHTGVTDATPAAVFVPVTAIGAVIGGQQAARWSTGYGSPFWGTALARRKPGVPVEQASADLTQAFRRSYEAQLAAEPGTLRRPVDLARPAAEAGAVRPGAGPDPSLEVRTALWVSGVALVVFVIAAANVANLLIGRAIARSRELAVRTALGAGRARLFTHAFAEGLLLAILGSAGALLLASVSAAGIFSLLVPGAAAIQPASSLRTIVMTGVAAAAVTVLLALVSAFAAGRASMATALRSGPRAGMGARPRLRAALVVVQTALSVLLVVGALLFVRSLANVRSIPLGYDADRVLIVNTVIRGIALQPAERIALRQRLLDAAAALPGVEAAAGRTSTPLGLNGVGRFSADGVTGVEDLGLFTFQEATPGYFEVMGTRILTGRGFTAADSASAPRVTVVSEGMARRLWPGGDPIGRCLRFGNPSSSPPCTAVVGIAEDIVQTNVTSAERYQYYVPMEQMSSTSTGLALRLAGDPAVEAERIRRTLQPLLPGTSYFTTQPLADLFARVQRSWRLGAVMFIALGGLALVVAAVGLFGLIRYHVTQRAHELGVRAALGAGRADLLRLVLGQQGWLTALGIAAGLGIAVAASAQIQPLLFNQPAVDVRAYAVAAAMVVLVAVLASALPALSASRTPPIRSLRAE